MRFGRGFGFRGWSPSWPYVGQGRGGLPRCWAYGSGWNPSYANPPSLGANPYPFPGGWGPYGMYDQPYAQFYPGYPQAMADWQGYYGSPMATGEGEKEWLKRQAEFIRQEIDQIKSRISELEKE